MNTLIRKLLLAMLMLLFAGQSALAQEHVTYFHTDAAGSPVAATDANGNTVWREDYLPYGERRTYDLSGGNNRNWFIGLPHSDEYGLTYMGSRYYDPIVGRFMAIDPFPVTEPYLIAFNRYAYANNNPYAYKDPDGEFLNFVFGGAKAAIENALIQQVEISLGLRTEFSWGELAFDTGLGVATSGLSTIKNAGRIGRIGAQMIKRGDDAAAVIKATKRNYRDLFRKSRPDLPNDWDVHHSLPQQYDELFAKKGINVHENKFLRGVDKDTHSKINKLWAQFHLDHGGAPTTTQITKFAEKIDSQFNDIFMRAQ